MEAHPRTRLLPASDATRGVYFITVHSEDQINL
jgi:hypothetical protein